jgi:hypothetical protein
MDGEAGMKLGEAGMVSIGGTGSGSVEREEVGPIMSMRTGKDGSIWRDCPSNIHGGEGTLTAGRGCGRGARGTPWVTSEKEDNVGRSRYCVGRQAVSG